MSTAERKVSPMHVAAQLLEEAVARMEAEAQASSDGGQAKRASKIRAAGEEVGAGQNAKTQLRGKAAKSESSPKPKLQEHPGKPAGRRKKA